MKFTIKSEHYHGITYDLEKLISVGEPFEQHNTWWSFWLGFDKKDECIDIICDDAEQECKRIHKEMVDAWKGGYYRHKTIQEVFPSYDSLYDSRQNVREKVLEAYVDPNTSERAREEFKRMIIEGWF